MTVPIFLPVTVILKNGNVGLGSNAPTQKLHVQGNALVTGNLVVSGTVNFNAPLTVGSNNGFRAATGATTGGSGSVAIGYNSIASSSQSTALGMQAKATNTSATALGYFANASGVGATALGPSANAAGAGAVAVGFHAEATGEGSIAIGDYTTAVDANSVVLGRLNKLPAGGGDPQLLVVGNGSPTTGRSNALVLTKSGKLGLGVDNPDKKLVVAGDARVTGTLYVEPRGGISMGAYEHIP